MKYRVYLIATASTCVEVDAKDESEAADLAFEQELPTICAQCSGWGRQVSMDLGEWDIADDGVEEAASGDDQ